VDSRHIIEEKKPERSMKTSAANHNGIYKQRSRYPTFTLPNKMLAFVPGCRQWAAINPLFVASSDGW
jgi:hypothetical protein